MRPIETILQPTDFSPGSEIALRVARGLARDLGARLVILHVAPAAVFAGGTMAAPIDMRMYHDAVSELVRRVDGPDLKRPVESVLRQGLTGEEILAAAQEIGAELIVMGTHGRRGLGRLLMGSVAETVLRRAPCPVLIIKPPRIPAPAPSPQREPELVEVKT